MFEYADDKSVGPDVDKTAIYFLTVGICAFVEDPRYKADSPLLLGGAQIQVVTGRSTKFQRFDNNQSEVRGIVVTSNDEVPVPGGKVILKNSLEGKAEYVTLDLTGGQFSTQIMGGWQTVKGGTTFLLLVTRIVKACGSIMKVCSTSL